MTKEQAKRLAEIKKQWAMWSEVRDTSSWETTFLLSLIQDLQREIRLDERAADKRQTTERRTVSGKQRV